MSIFNKSKTCTWHQRSKLASIFSCAIFGFVQNNSFQLWEFLILGELKNLNNPSKFNMFVPKSLTLHDQFPGSLELSCFSSPCCKQALTEDNVRISTGGKNSDWYLPLLVITWNITTFIYLPLLSCANTINIKFKFLCQFIRVL